MKIVARGRGMVGEGLADLWKRAVTSRMPKPCLVVSREGWFVWTTPQILRRPPTGALE